MDDEFIRYYVIDIFLTLFSFFFIIIKGDHTVLYKYIKWGTILCIWLFFTLPSALELSQALDREYVIITGEVVNKTSTRESGRRKITLRDQESEEIVKVTLLSPSIEQGDIITVGYLPHTKRGKMMEFYK